MTVKSNSTNSQLLVIEREFTAPRDLVFDAWTNPESLLQWFAPLGCTLHFAKIDIRPGGQFHSCIHNPSFGDCWCVGIYHEISKPERICYSIAIADEHGDRAEPSTVGHDPNWPQETTVTVTFEEIGQHTKITLTQNVSETLAKQTGAYPSWLEMLDRLAELLQE